MIVNTNMFVFLLIKILKISGSHHLSLTLATGLKQVVFMTLKKHPYILNFFFEIKYFYLHLTEEIEF